LSESKQDESFKVVDRRLFTPEGEFRKEVAEQQDRERETAPAAGAAGAAGATTPAGAVAGKPATPSSAPTAVPPVDAPRRSPAFENLVRSLGQNAAMLLGGYADPRTGQPVLDLEGATRDDRHARCACAKRRIGNLAPEEKTLLMDVLGNLKLAFMEMTKAAAKQEKQPRTSGPLKLIQKILQAWPVGVGVFESARLPATPHSVLELTVLGSGTSMGVPTLTCHCRCARPAIRGTSGCGLRSCWCTTGRRP
jgi:hypothetical protein